ncbi:MAG TPA: alpha/beta hydrolase [Candidatus Babeliales bacterium]|nr:alpha/beta hydrolase [Candidatus Babeliales bacterium]
MYIIKKIIVIICFIFLSTQAQSVFIIIHGTWGADCSWHSPKGDFFDALENAVCQKNSAVVSFRWSGGCGHESRVKAANNLIKLIKTYAIDTPLFIIAHSHGGTVAVLASQFLAQEQDNKYKICALFTLGTPIMSNYLPNMNVIGYVYNLFSFEDLVQTVLGISSREYPKHKRIANLRIMINGKAPDHAGLHHPIVGKWIAYIHHYFKKYLNNQNITNYISEPSIVYFSDIKAPEYAYDEKRNDLFIRDHQLSVLILDSFRNSLETGSNIPFTNL